MRSWTTNLYQVSLLPSHAHSRFSLTSVLVSPTAQMKDLRHWRPVSLGWVILCCASALCSSLDLHLEMPAAPLSPDTVKCPREGGKPVRQGAYG